jgi:hypothetical protein
LIEEHRVLARAEFEASGGIIELRRSSGLHRRGMMELVISRCPPYHGQKLGETLPNILLSLFHRTGDLVEESHYMDGPEEIVLRFVNVSVSRPAHDTVWLIGSREPRDTRPSEAEA